MINNLMNNITAGIVISVSLGGSATLAGIRGDPPLEPILYGHHPISGNYSLFTI